jgi:hypothetical protein
MSYTSKKRTRDMDEREGHWEKGYCDLHGREREGDATDRGIPYLYRIRYNYKRDRSVPDWGCRQITGVITG